jgi:hypothetical protein
MGLGIQSGINAGAQGVNTGVLSGLLAGTGTPNAGSATGNAQAAQWGKQNTFANAASTGLAAQQVNAEQGMYSQARRSESLVGQAQNAAQMQGDYAQRKVDQIGLAAQIQSGNIGFAAGLASMAGKGPMRRFGS